MNLKKVIKYFKKHESDLSIFLGVIVILVVGSFIIKNYNRTSPGETIPAIGTENEEPLSENIHSVKKGEDLWKIAETYYNSGYEWKSIANANNIKAPYIIEEGQYLTIPDLKFPTPSETVPNSFEKVKEVFPTAGTTTGNIYDNVITQSERYTVVVGDSLWKISLKLYGDGYRWTDIAKANNLKNPDLIHPGNVFVIPR